MAWEIPCTLKNVSKVSVQSYQTYACQVGMHVDRAHDVRCESIRRPHAGVGGSSSIAPAKAVIHSGKVEGLMM